MLTTLPGQNEAVVITRYQEEGVTGFMTSKCIDYGIKNKVCKFCSKAEEKGQEPSKHHSRKNFSASAKAMEPQICEELFRKENHLVMIGDEDSLCKARIRQNVNPDIQKWSDKNHVLRTLGKTLHQSKHFDFGAGNNRLNDTVIEYVLSCFVAALAKNKRDAKGLQKSLEAVVPHAFGSHDLCCNWCGSKEDPKSYEHKNLPGGDDLVGNGLRAFLEETLKPYMTDEVVDKLSPFGSTQRNESLNSVIGSKNKKNSLLWRKRK